MINYSYLKLIYIMKMNMKQIGVRIIARRKALGLTQAALAKILGLSSVSVVKWETAQSKPRGENLLALAEALKCTPNWLIFGNEEQEPIPVEHLPLELNAKQKRLLDLFEQLPEKEKDIIINELESKIESFNHLFEELLSLRKSRKNI